MTSLLYETQAGVRLMLELIGEDPAREGLIETPKRFVKAMSEMTVGYKMDPEAILSKQFDVKSDEIVLVRGVRFSSLCEHHILPFVGVAHVAYLPGEKVVGLSKLARLVMCFAKRLQVQERMTTQIADSLMQYAGARGVGVVVQATHQCMACRGVVQPDAEMVTSAMLGFFRENEAARRELMAMISSPRA